MAFTMLGNMNSGIGTTDKTAGTSITATLDVGTTLADRTIVYVCIVKNNDSTVDGETSEVTSVTDTKGNFYQKAKEFTNGQGAAAGGATAALWWSKLTTPLTTSDTITANFSTSVAASVIVPLAGIMDIGQTVQVEASDVLANDAADPGSMNLTVANIEHLWFRVCAHERPGTDVFTISASYLDGGGIGTTGGNVASNMSIGYESDIFTGTSNASNPSWDNAADEASILVAFKEITAPVTTSASGGWIGKGGWF